MAGRRGAFVAVVVLTVLVAGGLGAKLYLDHRRTLALAQAEEAWKAMLQCVGGTTGTTLEGADRLIATAVLEPRDGEDAWPGRCLNESRVESSIRDLGDQTVLLDHALDGFVGALDREQLATWIRDAYAAGRAAGFTLPEGDLAPPLPDGVVLLAHTPPSCPQCELEEWPIHPGGLLLRRRTDLFLFDGDEPTAPRRVTSTHPTFDAVFWTPGREPIVHDDDGLHALDGQLIVPDGIDALHVTAGSAIQTRGPAPAPSLAVRLRSGTVVAHATDTARREIPLAPFEISMFGADRVSYVEAAMLRAQSLAAPAPPVELGEIEAEGEHYDAYCMSGDHFAATVRQRLVIGDRQTARVVERDMPRSTQLHCRPDGSVRVLHADARDVIDRNCTIDGCQTDARRVPLPAGSVSVAAVGDSAVIIVRRVRTRFDVEALELTVPGQGQAHVVADMIATVGLVPHAHGAWLLVSGDGGLHVLAIDEQGHIQRVQVES